MILVAMMAKDLVKDLNDDDKKKIVDLFEQLEDYINDFNLDPSVLMNVGNIKDLESISDIEANVAFLKYFQQQLQRLKIEEEDLRIKVLSSDTDKGISLEDIIGADASIFVSEKISEVTDKIPGVIIGCSAIDEMM